MRLPGASARLMTALRFVLTLLLAVLVPGCGLLGQKEMWGVVVDVQAEPGSIHADSITVRDAAGVLHAFKVSKDVAVNGDARSDAAHLRLYMVEKAPVIVRYHDTSDGPVAFRVVDGPAQPQK